MGSVSAQQTAASGENQRVWAVPAPTERRPMHGRTTVLVALPQPRHAAPAAADVVASHRDLDGAVLSIEGTRTHAPTISMGALAVLVRSARPARRPDALVRGRLWIRTFA
jgi:hypothetical protein